MSFSYILVYDTLSNKFDFASTWLNYVGNDLDLWEMAQICGEMT